MTDVPATPHVPFRDAVRVWTRVALLSFGGPAAQIAVMHRIVVDEKRWLGEQRFLHALNYCMLLPGPEAQQLATYIGWLLHRTAGGLVAGLLFVLPGFVSMLALSVLYAYHREQPLVAAMLFGLKPAVVAIVVEAMLRIGGRVLKNGGHWGVAGASFVAIFLIEVPFPLLLLAAGLSGFLWSRFSARLVVTAPSVGTGTEPPAATVRPSPWRAGRVALLWLAIWLAPLALLAAWTGPTSVFVQEGLFFSKAAVVTFGGAYSVLAYIAQQAVEVHGWLRPGEMIDGLGLAETTPGPLIQVVQFVGFLGAYRAPAPLDPLAAGVLGSVVTTWVTFAPCFLWIFVGAPYIEYLRGRPALGAALSAITAAVVGVMLNLAIWFALHTLFGTVAEQHRFGLRLLVPDWTSIDPGALGIAVAAGVALLKYRCGMVVTLAGSVALGVLWRLVLAG